MSAPTPAPPPGPGRRTVVGAVVVAAGPGGPVVLVARRTTPPVGRWEFPGGKVEPGETPADALVREVAEELGCVVAVGREVGAPGLAWPISPTLGLRLFLAEVVAGEPRPGDSHDAVRWLDLERLDRLAWLPSDEQALPEVRAAVAEGYGLLRSTGPRQPSGSTRPDLPPVRRPPA